MWYRAQILARLDQLLADVAALAVLVSAPESEVPETSPKPRGRPHRVRTNTAPVDDLPPEPTGGRRNRAARWSYSEDSAYRIVGSNPFRASSNSGALFRELRELHGDRVFSRRDLRDAIFTLRRRGEIESVQQEPSIAIGFIHAAGERGRLEMVRVVQVPAKPPKRR